MLSRFSTLLVVLACISGFGRAQVPAAAPAVGYTDSFQIAFFTNGAPGGGGGSVFFPFTNSGFHASPSFPVTSGDVCVNAYIIASSGSMASCCACRVPSNSFAYILDAPYDYPGQNVTVKLVATIPASTPPGQPLSQCNARIAPPSVLGVPLGYASGVRAWAESQSDLSTSFYEKSLFSPAPLGDSEVARLTQQCSTASQCTCLPGVLPSGAAAPAGALRTSRSGVRNPFGIR